MSAKYQLGSRNLSKMAEAANRKMRKLKSNLSQKKSDITRSLSKIKKTDRLPYSDGYVLPGMRTGCPTRMDMFCQVCGQAAWFGWICSARSVAGTKTIQYNSIL